MKKTKKLTVAGVLIALGVLLSTFYIPLGVSKCFPIQHLINVVSAVVLGPLYAVGNAFVISLLRNILGLGSPLAFPGSMIGALLAGMMYKQFKNIYAAAMGEVVGTGIIGALLAGYFSIYLLGTDVNVLFFIVPFALSSVGGSLIALFILKIADFEKRVLGKNHFVKK